MRILLLFLSLCLISCGQLFERKKKSDFKQEFKSEYHNYYIEYPEFWTIKQEKHDNTVYLMGPDVDSKTIKKDGVFGIKVFRLPEELSSRETYDINMESFRSDPLYKEFRIEFEGEFLIDRKRAMRVIHKSTFLGQKLVSLQYYYAVGRKLYIMGGTVPGDDLEKYEELYDKMAKTFDL